MLYGIPISSPVVPRQETPVDLLVGCHQRIRHFSAISRRLAETPDAPVQQVSEAAEAVYRYFHVALPLHEADENVSIDPRLHDAAPPELAQASEEMVRQHRTINALLQQLLPLWDALCREPEKLPGFAPRLRRLSIDFEQLWDVHLKLEEEVVFPAIDRWLPKSEVDAILREMRERRA
jgi:hemerythrin-like domain-containing protein